MVDMAMWRNDRMAFDRIFRYFYTKSDYEWVYRELVKSNESEIRIHAKGSKKFYFIRVPSVIEREEGGKS